MSSKPVKSPVIEPMVDYFVEFQSSPSFQWHRHTAYTSAEKAREFLNKWAWKYATRKWRVVRVTTEGVGDE